MMGGSSLQRQTTVETESAISLFKRDFSKLGSFVDNMKETLCSSEVQFRAMERHIEQLVNENSHLKNELMKKEAQIQRLMEENGRLNEERYCWMQIFVKSCFSGKTIILDVKPTNTIDNITTMLPDKEGISRNRRVTGFYVTFGGKQLESKRTVAYYNIEKGSTLHYVACFTHESKIHVHIETPTGRTIDIHAAVSDTIDNLKLVVEDKTGMPVDVQGLIFRCRLLEGSRYLLDYAIHEGSTLYLVEKHRNWNRSVTVKVRNLSKKRFTLNVGIYDTIGSVKARIRDQEGLPPDGDRLFGLVFQGNSLDEDRIVGNYNIVTNSTICMVRK